ncbi:hypothetical protein KP509_15G002100 [Ceratopteris richardii]|uniref:TIR domain-containing protein n=1 Tax=Ceratopteris richardii TaxID=49495 RepID=A0A8T2T560_CERRI|nr:hypothetical protein KP509_15G002100 [Ceratopteris richardii]
MGSTDYNVFICHRGPDTKRNVVSVLQGMLHSKGIPCFVDYRMDEGNDVNFAIRSAIDISLVHIVILSPTFTTSSWCLDEVLQIMNIQKTMSTSNKPPRKVILVFYDVDSSMVRDMPTLNERYREKMKGWAEALEGLLNLKGFKYETKTAFEWEELDTIVSDVEDFVISRDIVPSNCDERERTWKIGLRPDYGSVFICHNKEDTQRNVVSVLRGILRSRGVTCLVVDYGREETQMKFDINNAIRDSRVHLIILSKSLAASKQCLDEIVEIMNVSSCKTPSDVTVLPVFYDVAPFVVRRQPEGSAYDLQNVKGSTDEERERWAKALYDLSCLKGFEYFTDRQTTLKKMEFQMMVNEVLQTLKERREEMKEITDFPVGLTKRVNDMWAQMSNYLYSSNNALQCFGLLGMGGVGKTTTAMSIYNKIRNQFEGSFFCLNTSARAAADASRLVSLQREMLQSLLSEKQYQDGRIQSAAHEEALLSAYRMDPTEQDQGGRIQSAAHGEAGLSACRMGLTNDDEVHEKALLSSKLRGINALVVLDDVDSIAQLEVLFNPLCSSLGASSLVLITSRNRKILEHAQSRHIFDIEELSEECSQRLFNWHAFLKPEAPPHLKEVSESVIGACKGLPLSLKVMGAHLYHESDKRYWDESLHFLRRNENDIFSVLRRSLDRLESDQKDAFLDISCFLVGENDVVSCAYLEGAYGGGWTHLKVLNSRCLLTLDREEGKWKGLCDTKGRTIGMHDQLRDMGRQFVRKEERNRAWDAESAKDLFKDETTRSALRGLSVSSDATLPSEATKCESLPRLLFLRVIDDAHHGGGRFLGNNSAGNVLKNLRCEELRLLVWRNARFQELPHGFRSIDLRLLDLRDSSICEFPPPACFTKLRYLDLSGTNIASVPHGISFANLEYMDLSRTKIKELPSGIRCPNLRRLYLSIIEIIQVPRGLYSTNLESLRLSGTNISKVQETSLPNLLLLDLRGCKRLKSPHAKFSASMTSLQLLDLARCESLEGLDSNIGWLINLRSFLLSGCHRLTCLPQEMTRLPCLEFLDLEKCTSFETLSFLPTTLQKLWLTGCSSLQTVSASLPKLHQLYAGKCRNLKRLPRELGACMRELSVSGCDGLEELLPNNQASFLGELPFLEVLDLQECTSLETLTFLPTTLEKLWLTGCSSLQTVNASLPSLQKLYAGKCTTLKRLPRELGACMRELSLRGCDGLEDLLPNNQALFFGELLSLELLDLRECTSLETLSFLPTTLQKLWLTGCSSLQTVNASLPKLQQLDAGKCTNLKKLSMELGDCVRELHLQGCDGLEELVAINQALFFEELPSLELLDLRECRSLETLSLLPTTLQKLWLNGCSSLQTVNASLPNLQQFLVDKCTNLKTLPWELGACMRVLHLEGCDGIEELLPTNQKSFFEELPLLEVLELHECTSLETLTFLPTTLEKLRLTGCSSLQTVNASLPSLQKLNAGKCRNLKRLPRELGACMRELSLRGCDGLEELLPNNQASFLGELPLLEVLELHECTSLETLTFLPTTLEKLRLTGCSSLQTVNASLPSLQKLNAGKCRNLKRLPRELGACMRELSLRGCDGLEELLPNNQASFLGELPLLEVLELHECTSLETLTFLPTTLEKLRLTGCSSLQTVNASLPSLQKLNAGKCRNLKRLPRELGACMRELSLRGCDGLQELLPNNQASFLGELSSLELLDLEECTSLETLSFLPSTLEILCLTGCSRIQSVNASLPNLQKLNAKQCRKLKRLPRELDACMRDLSLMGCDVLEELLVTNQQSVFGGLSSLEALDLQECTSLQTLSFLSTTLQKLRLNGCTSLRTVNASLPNLQALHAAECTNLERLPREMGACMRELSLKRCDGLEELIPTNQASFFGGLSSLEALDLQECTSLQTLSFLSTTLQKLRLNGCTSLRTVNASLPNLQALHAAECTNLERLPREMGACMRELSLKRCDGLEELIPTNQASFFGGFCSLEILDLCHCTSLTALSFLPTSLKQLILVQCIQLEVLELGSGNLTNRKHLDIRGCPHLRSLPREIESLPGLRIIRD